MWKEYNKNDIKKCKKCGLIACDECSKEMDRLDIRLKELEEKEE